MSKTTGYLDRARKRQIESPGWNWRRYLRKAGRRDGRKNIPDLEGDGWPTGVIQELANELDHGLRLFGTDFFTTVEPLNREVIARRCQRDACRDTLEERGLRAHDADSAVAAALSSTKADEHIRLRRRSREATAASASARPPLRAAEETLAVAIACRQDAANKVREHAYSYIGLIRSAMSIYWTANLRVRRRAVQKRPDHIVFDMPTLPEWLTSDAVFDHINEAVAHHGS